MSHGILLGRKKNNITSFADLDDAFEQSPGMLVFKNKIISNNPLSKLDSNNFGEAGDNINLISRQSEERMNHNVDEIINSSMQNIDISQHLQNFDTNVNSYENSYVESDYNVGVSRKKTIGTFILVIILIVLLAALAYWIYIYCLRNGITFRK